MSSCYGINITTMNFTVSAPIRKKTVLVFDVETSGLLPKKNKSNPNHIPVEAYPHILQLSYALYDISSNELLDTYDTYIKVNTYLFFYILRSDNFICSNFLTNNISYFVIFIL